ncbi:uncharacterized protein LOC119984775 isoform X1 [Tripterygium wilfordii]|uniref:uncharacterized protein LOC119984775 isoform X1 n=1 Tax=Tripterygium wilfordii TaxID=458696 RepID=UPI0018F809D1|nr:uncharacterized protein LOC119984775 isoform X1 [Tripterygium wilfordii]
MFVFTSLGGKIDRTTNDSQGPFVFKLGGQSYHRIGSLLPMDGEAPKFTQLYIQDTDHEVFDRMMVVGSDDNDSIEGEIVRELMHRFISIKIPNESTESLIFETVKKFMVHGPCGVARPSSPCMSDGRCTKHYPKSFHQETMTDENGFALYRRRDDGKTIFKNGHALDNRFIVLYNKVLLLQYQAHVNIERSNKSTTIKYLFKYINKGPDRSRAMLEKDVLLNAPTEER